MSEVEFTCPYCEHKQWIEIEDMDQFDKGRGTCDGCNKSFYYRIQISVEGYTDKIEVNS